MDSNKKCFVYLEMDYKPKVYPCKQIFDQGCSIQQEEDIPFIDDDFDVTQKLLSENTQEITLLLNDLCILVSDQVQSSEIVCRECHSSTQLTSIVWERGLTSISIVSKK